MTLFLRPSASHRWFECSESLFTTSDDLPDHDTDAAREGTCAAWVAECVLNGDAGSADDLLGRVHKNGWEVDEDMVRYVQPYIELCETRTDGIAEETWEITWPDGQGGHKAKLAGTSDHKGWANTERKIRHITDLKFGYGIVEPFENRQLLCYAYLDYAKMVADGVTLPEMYVLSIYQPRAQHPNGVYRKWVISMDEALVYFRQINDRVESFTSGGTRVGSWCDHCLRAARCAALTESIYSMWTPVSDRPFLNPTGQQLADELAMLERFETLFKARQAAVEAEAEVRIKQRKFVPGWGMVNRQGKSAWKFEAETIRMMTGIDPYVQKVVTPAELKRRGANKDVVKELTHTPTIGQKLGRVTESDIARQFGELPK